MKFFRKDNVFFPMVTDSYCICKGTIDINTSPGFSVTLLHFLLEHFLHKRVHRNMQEYINTQSHNNSFCIPAVSKAAAYMHTVIVCRCCCVPVVLVCILISTLLYFHVRTFKPSQSLGECTFYLLLPPIKQLNPNTISKQFQSSLHYRRCYHEHL